MARWKRNETPQEEFDAMSERCNAYISFDEIRSEKDYFDALEKQFDKNGVNFPRRYYSNLAENNKELQKRLEEAIEDTQQAELFAKAQRIERRRRLRSREVDESRTSRRVITRLTGGRRGTLARWKRNPARTDILGIDTRLARRLSERNIITSRDVALRKYKVTLTKSGRKVYRWNINEGKIKKGRFARSPFSRRR